MAPLDPTGPGSPYTFINVTHSVGRGKTNGWDDVLSVQAMLAIL